ncbi:hypothetical protein [Marinobacter subterrani]|uniref:Uncharacterized protein n=1 Tax=Marinobacter subterrani TaxID=1658765 RepID=A0A0J7J3F0_9GAMM|nr:hypothetical protein [Marinobacter subterrani]KMQ73028.1 hypothetical protein Msub_20224 [Marinobacter subterrani]
MNAEQLKQLEDDLWSAADNLRANSVENLDIQFPLSMQRCRSDSTGEVAA